MAEYLMIAAVNAESAGPGVTVVTHPDTARDFYWPTELFEANAVEIQPGTGAALKAVAATALLHALHTGLPQEPANDDPSAAERGEFNDAMVTAVARIAFNVIREWRKYEGILHPEQFDFASETQQNMARTRVRNIAENRRYPLDIANKAMVFEDQLYRVVTAAVLAD